MKPESDESKIEGNWLCVNGTMQKDSASQRIEYLVNSYLTKISVSEDCWSTLYQDPEDNRLWELTYLQSEVFSGGPPCLMVISAKDAHKKYPEFKKAQKLNSL